MKKLFAEVLSVALVGGALCATAYAAPAKIKHAIVGETTLRTPLQQADIDAPAARAKAATSRLAAKQVISRAVDAVTPPHTFTFETDLEGFSVIDANADGTTWKQQVTGGKGVAVLGFASHVSNDWLISPAVELKAGGVYQITVDAKGYSKSFEEKFEVKAGRAADVDALTETVLEPVAFKSQDFTSYSGEFTATETGVYYFGIHGISDPNMFGLLIDQLAITVISEPAEVTAIEPPFTADFATSLDGFTIIDANEDGTTWRYSAGQANVWGKNDADTDDWLVAPAMQLVGGRTYGVTIDAKGMSKSYEEGFEIMAGTAAEAAAMTSTVISRTTFKMQAYETFSGEFTAPADGVYYFGIHGISPKGGFGLYVDNFTVSAPQAAPALPAGATALTATAATDGTLKAVIAFTAPALTDDGETLTALTKIEVTRGDAPVKTFDAPAPGAELSFEDTVDAPGEYTYSVTAYNAVGAGLTVSTTVYIGVDLPAAIENVTYKETSTPGQVTISWDPVTTDVNGNAIDPALVSYDVYIMGNSEMTLVGGDVKGTSYTYQAVPAGTQKFVQFAVFPVTSKGEGDAAATDFGPVGTPYNGFSMTTEADLDRYILGLNIAGGANVGIYGDTDFDDFATYEGDDFCLGFFGKYADTFATIFTGKITLEGMVNPTFSYYVYNLGLDGTMPYSNEVVTEIVDMATGVKTAVSTVVAGQSGPVDEWNRVAVDLSAYAGKVISIEVSAYCKTASYTFIDNLSVGSLVDHDLEASNVIVPANVLAGSDFTASVVVKNVGAKAAAQYKVSLYANGALVEARDCTDLAAGTTVSIDFTITTSPIDADPVALYATVEAEGDEVTVNNTTPTVTVEVITSEYPAVTDLEATASSEGVELSWTEPDLESAPSERITESFEDGDAFSAEFGAWTFVDVDQSPVGGISTMDIPGITPGTTTGSFWVWDSNLLTDRLTGARTGKKFLFSLFRYDDQQADDWAISPELFGKAQTITFYAKSYTATYREHIEVYYSTTGTELSDFIKVMDEEVVMPYWEEYNINLPEGAKYFAIRSMATAGYMLAIDDVSFTPAGNANLDLVGYNVYRDGVKLNDEIVEEPEYTDTTAVDGRTYSYVVTTVYTKGESAASNVAEILYKSSGIGSIAAPADPAVYFNLQGMPVDTPQPGEIYIRRQGASVSKVVVK